jgi:hypothetical protein
MALDWQNIFQEWLKTRFDWDQLRLAAIALLDKDKVEKLQGLIKHRKAGRDQTKISIQD